MADFIPTRRYLNNSDAHIHHNIRIKRMSFSSVNTPPIIEIEKMFDQFYIFGAPPDITEHVDPVLLVTYPSTTNSSTQTNEILNQLKSFSFPSGFHEINNENNNTKKGKNQKVSTHINNDQILLNEFVFYLSSNSKEKTYGICVQFQIPSTASPFFCTHFSRKYPFCLCFLSKVPFLSSHFQFASYLALFLCGSQKSLKGQGNDLHKPRIPIPVKGFCHSSLTLDKNFPAVAVLKGFSVPKLFFEELTFYHNLPVNPDISDMRSRAPIPLSNEMALCVPYHFTRNKCLAYPTFHAFFSALNPSAIVKIYTSLLLEQRILFVSQDLQLASFAVIASNSLISPLISQACIAPILPDDERFQCILQSPVPYVVGSTTENENADVIVDLDNGSISTNSDIPSLPESELLIQKLEQLISSSSESILVPPKEVKSFFGAKSMNPAYDKFMDSTNVYVFPTVFTKYTPIKYILTPFIIEDILTLFSEFFIPSVNERIASCFVTDTTDPENPITVLNKDLLMNIVPNEEKEFYSSFIATQVFSEFCEKKADEFSKSKLDNIEKSKKDFSHSISLPSFRKKDLPEKTV
ncbi:hypothetical protein TRFO_19303 [Tritrichomonas foetus]|uniref:UDENN domain-containing protein n=1 Tax=Tritrichomonas foetus TaxID=1144522 RepID=A0A1J4KNP5_9EUKA|nr:hypothetical protein TRFO_19303 [Tritrichomonas foetus]|eukprot:OHT11318.1 hypothetical protein TRFO_19303 [Tritrichomonas foetus]